MKLFFRIIAFLEGTSYILLLFIATPIRHFYDNPYYVELLGMPHGILFMIYVALAIWLKPDYKWEQNIFIRVLVASVIPFGTFYAEKKYFKGK